MNIFRVPPGTLVRFNHDVYTWNDHPRGDGWWLAPAHDVALVIANNERGSKFAAGMLVAIAGGGCTGWVRGGDVEVLETPPQDR